MESEEFLQQKDPITILEAWLKEAEQIGLKQPHAFTLATVDHEGQPSARVVLYKGLSQGQLHFYTNYDSVKGQNITQNPKVAAHFYWDTLGRQVKIKGVAQPMPREESEAYWSSRPRESQVAQYISRQSQVAPSRASLEEAFTQAQGEFSGSDIPCPEHWGGYQLQIKEIEFWIADKRRFHDRFHYMKVEDCWQNRRLYP